jgi:hypothetical protein
MLSVLLLIVGILLGGACAAVAMRANRSRMRE